MFIAALLALIVVANSANADEVTACDKDGLLAMLHEAPKLEARSQNPKAQTNIEIQFLIHESPLVMDGFKYDGVVDPVRGLAWIIQYGGISGNIQWFGPV